MEITRTSLPVNLPDGISLEADLAKPDDSKGLVIFAHGSGSNRFSPRNRQVADIFNEGSLATLLIDLLTIDEQEVDQYTRHLRFDIPLLGRRVVGAIDWVRAQPSLRDLPMGLYGASTGAAGAMVAASQRPDFIGGVVSRGGRVDLAADILPRVECPVLLIVGGYDLEVLELNRSASRRIRSDVTLKIVPEASHLLEEPGKLEEAANLAMEWLQRNLIHVPVAR